MTYFLRGHVLWKQSNSFLTKSDLTIILFLYSLRCLKSHIIVDDNQTFLGNEYNFFYSGAGDWNLFCTLEAPLVAAMPQDSCEWRRSYGRVNKSVYLEASFVKYNKEKLGQLEYNLLKKPIFNIYWTDCAVSMKFCLHREVFCILSACANYPACSDFRSEFFHSTG